jgi:hypothetical protein
MTSSGFPTKTVNEFLICPKRAVSHAHLIPSSLIVVTFDGSVFLKLKDYSGRFNSNNLHAFFIQHTTTLPVQQSSVIITISSGINISRITSIQKCKDETSSRKASPQ